MRIIRRASLTPVPWKNGGGITHEVLRSPAAGQGRDEAFDWRVSIARIDASGPFSDFAGYWRFMVLLEGPGLILDVDGAPAARLLEPGDMTDFDGGRATRCELLTGSCTDLNLMASTAVQVLHAGTLRLAGAHDVSSDPQVTDLVCVVSGQVDIEPAAGRPDRLGPGDVAVWAPAKRAVGGGAGVRSVTPRAVLRTATGRRSAAALVFLASLDDNPAGT